MTQQSRPAPRRMFRPDLTRGGRTLRRLLLAGTALGLLAACDRPLDFDMRGNFGNTLDTAEAARQPVANRPAPDARGVISYPNYQVAVARRGDTVTDVASRVGISAEELARFNGLRPADTLRPDEVVALPRRVAEPSPATGGFGTVQAEVEGRTYPLVDHAGYAPFGFGYRRCAGETLTVDLLKDVLRRIWRDGIRFERTGDQEAERLPVGPGTVISDDIRFARAA